MGLSAEFLLRRDLNYRLAQAQETFTQIERPSEQFLQPYDWVEQPWLYSYSLKLNINQIFMFFLHIK